MSLRLYEEASEVRVLLETEIDPETGEVSDLLVATLGRLKNTGRSVAAWVLNLRAEEEAAKAHVAAVQARIKRIRRDREWGEGYLAMSMRESGTRSFDAIDGTFTCRFYPGRDESVQIADGVELPDALCRIKTVREPDKVAIRAAIEAGEPVPAGVEIVRRDRLTIK